MEEVKVEKTPSSTYTTINRTEKKSSGSGMLWFIVGGLFVAVIVIAFFVLDDSAPLSDAAAPTGGDVSVNIDTAPAAADDAEADTAPAPAEVAPAEE